MKRPRMMAVNAAVFIDFLMAMAYNIGEQRNLID